MDSTQEYVVNSLELHLFFARIMKEHAFFLKVGFQPTDAGFAGEGERFLRQFEALLSRALTLSDRVIGCDVLHSGELFTKFTGRAESQTQRLTGTRLDRRLTERAMQLRCRAQDEDLRVSQNLLCQVRRLNQEGLRLVNGLISFKQRLLDKVNCCGIYTANYPLLIEHILREARLYRANLLRLEGLPDEDIDQLRDSEWFWDRIMMEHALFIRGLLDPSEDELIGSANRFAADYRRLLDASAGPDARSSPNGNTLALTERFRDFKLAGVEGIEECQIRSIILPLLADHVLREANHYIRLLEGGIP